MGVRTFASLLCILVVVQSVHSQLGLFGQFLADDDYVRSQLNCLQDRGACDRNGRMIKAALPEVVGRNCARCTPQQRLLANSLINYASQRYPREWQAIAARYG